ncbi:MAG: Hsp20/alpha crystallin family protein [Myxococcota bacterium]
MSNEQSTAMQKREGAAMESPEATRPGRLVVPAVDIFEDQTRITVVADMPGVRADDLKVDLDEGVLTISGPAEPAPSSAERIIFQEYDYGTFQRKFTLSEAIDTERIEAHLADGVLRLELPKAEKARPKKIAIRTE